jgi:hypothetical protein
VLTTYASKLIKIICEAIDVADEASFLISLDRLQSIRRPSIAKAKLMLSSQRIHMKAVFRCLAMSWKIT